MYTAFSCGQDNDELIDHLVESGYIKSKKIEQVFRAVDRGDYFLSSHRKNAYKDSAWKHGNIHLSAPSIYCKVIEELALKPGLSFLNLGSGTGYLNTIAGLILTQRGTNHGIELYSDCVRYSYDRLDEFKQRSLALDEFDFCEPVFVQGNCLSVVSEREYDRVYCGATCPGTHVALIQNFVKDCGILVMPYKDHLVRLKRMLPNLWERRIILPVSFTNLIIPASNETVSHLPNLNPLSLQELCRKKIRFLLRLSVRLEYWNNILKYKLPKPITSERNRPSLSYQTLHQSIILNDEINIFNYITDVSAIPSSTDLQFLELLSHLSESDDTEDEVINRPSDEEESHSVEEDTRCDTNPSSKRERRDFESSSDSTCEKSHSESNNLDDNREKFDERPKGTTAVSAYSNMSESEEEEDRNGDANKLPRSPSQKQSNQGYTYGGIVVEVCNTGNDEESLSSNSDFSNVTPVKHKRSSTSTTSSSNHNNSSHRSRNKRESSYKRSPLKRAQTNETLSTGHYAVTNTVSTDMKKKIHQLPLPYSLKLYINYNRNL